MATEMNDRNFRKASNNVSHDMIGLEKFQGMLNLIMKVKFKKKV
jgi:hypothetical protein